MHGTVPEILPCVQEADGDPDLEGWDDDPVNCFRHHDLPHGKRRDLGSADAIKLGGQERIMPTGQSASQQRVGGGHVLGDRCRIESEHAEDRGECPLRDADARRPYTHVVILHPGHLLRFGQI